MPLPLTDSTSPEVFCVLYTGAALLSFAFWVSRVSPWWSLRMGAAAGLCFVKFIYILSLSCVNCVALAKRARLALRSGKGTEEGDRRSRDG